jgi:chemotaxis protein MotB
MRTFIFLSGLWIFCNSCSTGKRLGDANHKNQTLIYQDSVLQCHDSLLNSELSDCKKYAAAVAEENNDYRNKLLAANAARMQTANKLEEMDRILDNQSVSLSEIRKKIFVGLHKIQDTGIYIKYLYGMISVSMQNQFMFSSGSTKLNKEVIQALSVIAEVLNKYSQVTAIIVGNTDSLDIQSGKYVDNWSLSTERSNAIARLLIKNFNTDPTRIVVVGKSKYNPVASNQTVLGRSQNRRTEIIINPDLSRLWQLSQKYP